MDRERFEAAVGTARAHVRAGDCLQVVVSRRIDRPFSGDPLRLYTGLRSRNPGPYLYLVEEGDRAVVGASPEMLLRVEDGGSRRFRLRERARGGALPTRTPPSRTSSSPTRRSGPST